MKKSVAFGFVVFSLVLVLSLSFVSAGFFGDFLNKITGKATYDDSIASKETKEVVQSICAETDKGIDYYNKGTIEEGENSREDFCLSTGSITETQTHLNEFYCNSLQEMVFEIYKCPEGCVDGACIREGEQEECSDSDGGINYEVKGTATDSLGNYTDYCLQTGKLNEYNCAGDRVIFSSYACEGVCLDGACNFVTEGVKEEIDIYVEDEEIIEGTGIEEEQEVEEEVIYFGPGAGGEVSCYDDDEWGREPYVQDLTTINNERLWDECVVIGSSEGETAETNTLREYYCDGDLGVEELINCEEGCSKGACLMASQGVEGEGESEEDVESTGFFSKVRSFFRGIF